MVNEWTRNDLPSADEARDVFMETPFGASGFEAMLDAVVAHLNANGGVPTSCEDAALEDRLERQAATISELQGSFLRVERDAARWRRAHAIVEAERDTARERLREVDSALAKCMSDYQDVEDERDAAEYAEAEMERERDEWRASADKWHGEWQKIAPASTVTREDIEKAISELRTFPRFLTYELLVLRDEAVDVAWALVSGEAEPADPVEAKARELWEVARFKDSDEWSCLLQVERDCYRRMAAHVLGQEAGDE